MFVNGKSTVVLNIAGLVCGMFVQCGQLLHDGLAGSHGRFAVKLNLGHFVPHARIYSAVAQNEVKQSAEDGKKNDRNNPGNLVSRFIIAAGYDEHHDCAQYRAEGIEEGEITPEAPNHKN